MNSTQPNAKADALSSDPSGLEVLKAMSKEELIALLMDDAKNWLAHDGLWFQAIEASHGMEVAMDADREAWRKFSQIEARRIKDRLNLPDSGGIPALVTALNQRLYARLNIQECVEQTDTRVVFRMVSCRVQAARERKNMPHFPCKSVGIVEYEEFARAIDARIKTRCVQAPPDVKAGDTYHCGWEFYLDDQIPVSTI